MDKKYLVMAGYVISKEDGDQHYIGAVDLMKLYGVEHSECVIANPKQLKSHLDKLKEELIVLRPLYQGEYDTYLKEK